LEDGARRLRSLLSTFPQLNIVKNSRNIS